MRRWNLCAGLLLAIASACSPVDTGSSSVGPGSDGGPIFTGGDGTGNSADAGSTGGGATLDAGGGPALDAGSTGGRTDGGTAGDGGTGDAGSGGGGSGIDAGSGGGSGTDAGSGGGGGIDAGSGGGASDGGSTGGGVASGCDGVLPTSAPAASTAIVPHTAGQACYYFTSDQKGDVAAEAHSGVDPAETLGNTHWQVYSPAGSPTGRFNAGADLYGEPDGFEGGSRDATSTSIVKWSITGAETKRVLLAGADCTGRAFLAVYNGVLGLGGCTDGVLTGVIFDATGSAVLSRTIVNQPVDASGVTDFQGRSVVVLAGSTVGVAAAYAARWFDKTLSPMTPWFALPGSGPHPSLQPLIGGGAAYKVADNWVATLVSGIAGASAPPAFLAGHTKNDFRVVRNGRAYARIAQYGAAEPRNKLELYDAASNHCGTGTFPGEGLTVGHDGTVFASGGDGGCNVSWYSGVLR